MKMPVSRGSAGRLLLDYAVHLWSVRRRRPELFRAKLFLFLVIVYMVIIIIMLALMPDN